MKIYIKITTLLEIVWKFCATAGITHLLMGHLLFEVIIPSAWAEFCVKLNYDYNIWHLLILSGAVSLLWQAVYEWHIYRKRKNQAQRNIVNKLD